MPAREVFDDEWRRELDLARWGAQHSGKARFERPKIDARRRGFDAREVEPIRPSAQREIE